MLKNRFFSAALIALACAAALTACTANSQTSDNDGTVGSVEEGVSEMISDVQDGLGDKEDATHGIKPEDKNENEGQRHRPAVPSGK